MCVALAERAGDTVTEKKTHHGESRRFHINAFQMGLQVELAAPAQSSESASLYSVFVAKPHGPSKCSVLLQ